MSEPIAVCVIELIHTATLVHDDVVDDSNRRRGFSIKLWKNKIAVLVGDYLLSDCCFLLIMAIYSVVYAK
jgi:octaprenyl-diphosphate synthase